MKRLFAALLCCALLAADSTGLAYDWEITFRDFAWGVDFKELKPTLDKIGYCFYLTHYPARSVSEMLNYGLIDYEEPCIMLLVQQHGIDSVGGYKPDSVELYFAYMEEDGRIDTSTKTSFYAGRYGFRPKNGDQVYNDLSEKLVSIYGNPDQMYSQSNKHLKGLIDNVEIWEGANDTDIGLVYYDWSSDPDIDDEVYIYYVWEKGDELLQQANDVAVQNKIDDEAANYGTGNTDGL